MASRSFLPPGFRFHPTDEELTMHYLKRKVCGKQMDGEVIGELDFYKFEPSDLPGLSVLRSRDPEWYFFSALDKKYPHGSRCNRTTRVGYWKATGKDREIKSGAFTVGMKKTLIYYVGRSPKGERTDWVMHEYRLDEKYEKKIRVANSYVLCRLRKKGGPGPRNGEQYGAPVSEVSDDEGVDGLSEVLVSGVSSDQSEYLDNVKQAQSTDSHNDLNLADISEFDAFLSLLSSKAEEQKPTIIGSVFPTDIERVAETPSPGILQLDIEGPENFHDLLHPLSDEADILEEMLHFVEGEEGSLSIPESHLQDVSRNMTFFGNGLMVDSSYVDLFNKPVEFSGASGDLIFEPVGGSQMQSRKLAANEITTIPVLNPTLEKGIHLVGAGNKVDSHSLLTQVSEEGFREPSEAGSSVFYDGSTFYSGLSNQLIQTDNEYLKDGHYDEALFMPRDFDTEHGGEVTFEGASLIPGEYERSSVEIQPTMQSTNSPPSPTSFIGVLLAFLGDGPVLPASASEIPVEQHKSKSQNTSYNSQFSDTPTKRENAGLSSPYNRKPTSHHRMKPSSSHYSSSSKVQLSQFSSDKNLRKTCGFLSSSLFWLAATTLILFCEFCTSSKSRCSL